MILQPTNLSGELSRRTIDASPTIDHRDSVRFQTNLAAIQAPICPLAKPNASTQQQPRFEKDESKYYSMTQNTEPQIQPRDKHPVRPHTLCTGMASGRYQCRGAAGRERENTKGNLKHARETHSGKRGKKELCYYSPIIHLVLAVESIITLH